MSDFNINTIPNPKPEVDAYIERRLDAEWATLNAIREMLGISLKGKN